MPGRGWGRKAPPRSREIRSEACRSGRMRTGVVAGQAGSRERRRGGGEEQQVPRQGGGVGQALVHLGLHLQQQEGALGRVYSRRRPGVRPGRRPGAAGLLRDGLHHGGVLPGRVSVEVQPVGRLELPAEGHPESGGGLLQAPHLAGPGAAVAPGLELLQDGQGGQGGGAGPGQQQPEGAEGGGRRAGGGGRRAGGPPRGRRSPSQLEEPLPSPPGTCKACHLPRRGSHRGSRGPPQAPWIIPHFLFSELGGANLGTSCRLQSRR